jgi:hypothetical protein
MTTEYHEASTTQNHYEREARMMAAERISEANGDIDRLALLLDDPPELPRLYTRAELDAAIQQVVGVDSSPRLRVEEHVHQAAQMIVELRREAYMLRCDGHVQTGRWGAYRRMTEAALAALDAELNDILRERGELNPLAGPAPF